MANAAAGYDAFLSYSHDADAETAKVLCGALESFGRGFLQARRFRIWHDDSSLRLTASLQDEINRALENSNHLLVLLSPQAMSSPWVEREVRYFVERHGPDRVGLVLTRGTTPWTDAAGEAQLTLEPALTPLLQNRSEPLVIDLRRHRGPDGTLQRTAAFMSTVATIAATLANTTKDEIYGAHIRSLRRRVAMLVVIAVLLAGAVVLAVAQTRRAERSRQEQRAGYAELLAERGGQEHEAFEEAVRAAAWGFALPDLGASWAAGTWDFVVQNRAAPSPVFTRALVAASAALRRSRVLAHHGGTVYSASFADGDTQVVTASGDCTVCVLEIPSRQCKRELIRQSAQTWAHPAPAGLLTAERGSVFAWDAELRTPVWEIDTRDTSIQRFAAGGELLLTQHGQVVQLWNWRRRELLRAVAAHVSAVSRDFSILAVYVPQSIVVARIGPDGSLSEPIATVAAIGDVRALTLSPDGSRLFAGMLDGQVFIWDVQSKELIYRLQGHSASVNALELSNDGLRIVTASSDGTARVWDASSGSMTKLLRQHDWLTTASFSRDNLRVLTSSNDGNVRLANLVDTDTVIDVQPDAPERFPETESSNAPPKAARFSRDGRHVISVDGQRLLKRWRIGAEDTAFEVSVANTLAFTEAPAGTLVAVTAEGNVIRAESATAQSALALDTGRLARAVVSPGGRYACVGDRQGRSRLVRLSDARASNAPCRTSKYGVAPVVLDDVTTNVEDDNSIHVVDNASGAALGSFREHKGSVSALAITSDQARAISASADGKVFVWDTRSGARSAEGSYPAYIVSIELAQDDRRALLIDQGRHVHVFDLSDGKEIDGEIDRGPVVAAKWAGVDADSMRLVTAASGGRTTLWSLGVPEPLGHFETLSTIASLAVAPGGRQALVLGYDGRVFVLPASSDEIVQQACGLAMTEGMRPLAERFCRDRR